MEKTIQITIASTIFQLTESAYNKLSAYLDSLKTHFASEIDKDEILRDIEARIAEKLLDKKHTLVTEADITRVTSEMGDASQFGDDTSGLPPQSETAKRKLYRDIDNAMIAGVAAGIASYFNIEVTIVRLVFLISIFFGGTGIFLYVLLIFIIPAARTASQKLEMRGDPVTLESISRMVKDRIEDTKTEGTLKRIVSAPFKLLRIIIGFFVPLFGKLLGLGFIIGSFFAILGSTAAIAVTAANWNKPYMDAPILDIISPYLAWTGIIAGYIALLIPLVLIFSLGHRMLRGKSLIPSAIGFGLVGIWCLAIVTFGAVTTRVVGEYYAYTSTSPDYQSVTETLTVTRFNAIDVEGGNIRIQHGDTQSVTVRGRQKDMGNVAAEVIDGTLTIRPVENEGPCFLCDTGTPRVTVTTPNIDTLEMMYGVADFENFESESLTIQVRNGSVRGEIEAGMITVNADYSSVRTRLNADSLVVKARSSDVNLEGAATSADISLEYSSLSSRNLLLGEATIRAMSSSAYLNVGNEFTIERNDYSDIENIGRATTTARTD